MYCHLFVLLLGIATVQCLNNFDTPALYQVTDPVDHAECPTWDGRKNVLYFVDLHEGTIYAYDYNSKVLNTVTLNGEIAPVLPSKNDPNSFIVGLNRSVVAVQWDGTSDSEAQQQILVTVSEDRPTSRMNEGKADKQGRLWIGTMGREDENGLDPNAGTLYKITRDTINNPEPMISPVNISNGLAWNQANDKFYYIDTVSGQIAEYDYDDATGTISNRRVAFELFAHDLPGGPDGMTIDVDDNLWIALFGGGSIIQVNPNTGELLRRIAIPADNITSVMWGGPDLDILFVTTSRYNLSEEDRKKQPGAGSVFALKNLGTRGLPVFGVDII